MADDNTNNLLPDLNNPDINDPFKLNQGKQKFTNYEVNNVINARGKQQINLAAQGINASDVKNYQAAIQQQRANKSFGFAQMNTSINQISQNFQNSLESTQSNANARGLGGVNSENTEGRIEQSYNQTMTQQFSSYTQGLQKANQAINQNQSQLFQLLKPLSQDYFAQTHQGDKKFTSMVDNEGILGHIGGDFGHDQLKGSRIDKEKLRNDSDYRTYMTGMGLNPDDDDLLNQVVAAGKNAVEIRYGSNYDITGDVMNRAVNGTYAKVGEVHKSIGKAILDDTMGAIDIATLVFPAFKIGSSIVRAGGELVGNALLKGGEQGLKFATTKGIFEGAAEGSIKSGVNNAIRATKFGIMAPINAARVGIGKGLVKLGEGANARFAAKGLESAGWQSLKTLDAKGIEGASNEAVATANERIASRAAANSEAERVAGISARKASNNEAIRVAGEQKLAEEKAAQQALIDKATILKNEDKALALKYTSAGMDSAVHGIAKTASALSVDSDAIKSYNAFIDQAGTLSDSSKANALLKVKDFEKWAEVRAGESFNAVDKLGFTRDAATGNVMLKPTEQGIEAGLGTGEAEVAKTYEAINRYSDLSEFRANLFEKTLTEDNFKNYSQLQSTFMNANQEMLSRRFSIEANLIGAGKLNPRTVLDRYVMDLQSQLLGTTETETDALAKPVIDNAINDINNSYDKLLDNMAGTTKTSAKRVTNYTNATRSMRQQLDSIAGSHIPEEGRIPTNDIVSHMVVDTRLDQLDKFTNSIKVGKISVFPRRKTEFGLFGKRLYEQEISPLEGLASKYKRAIELENSAPGKLLIDPIKGTLDWDPFEGLDRDNSVIKSVGAKYTNGQTAARLTETNINQVKDRITRTIAGKDTLSRLQSGFLEQPAKKYSNSVDKTLDQLWKEKGAYRKQVKNMIGHKAFKKQLVDKYKLSLSNKLIENVNTDYVSPSFLTDKELAQDTFSFKRAGASQIFDKAIPQEAFASKGEQDAAKAEFSNSTEASNLSGTNDAQAGRDVVDRSTTKEKVPYDDIYNGMFKGYDANLKEQLDTRFDMGQSYRKLAFRSGMDIDDSKELLTNWKLLNMTPKSEWENIEGNSIWEGLKSHAIDGEKNDMEKILSENMADFNGRADSMSSFFHPDDIDNITDGGINENVQQRMAKQLIPDTVKHGFIKQLSKIKNLAKLSEKNKLRLWKGIKIAGPLALTNMVRHISVSKGVPKAATNEGN